MKSITLYMISATLLLSGSVAAQELITLKEYQQYVVEYSQRLKQVKEQVTQQTNKRKADRTGFLPKLDAGASGTIDLTNTDLWNAPLGVYHPYNYFTGGTLTQVVWAGNATQELNKSNKIQEKVAQENVLLTLDNIYLQADQTYWNASANREFLTINQNYYEIVKSQYEIIKTRFEAGFIAQNDLLMITTRLKDTELNLKRSEANYLIAHQNLNILMGVAPNHTPNSTESILKSIASPWEVNFEDALSQRPDYRAAELQVSLAERSRKLALSQFNPQIILQMQGGWGTASPNLGADPRGTVLSTLSFSMPIWHWGERKFLNRQYKSIVNSTVYNQQAVSDQISVEISNAATNMDQSHEQIRIAEDNLTIAQQSLDLNTLSYNEGRINIADLLSAQLTWIQAYTNNISANYAYKVAVASYKKAIGKITPDNSASEE